MLNKHISQDCLVQLLEVKKDYESSLINLSIELEKDRRLEENIKEYKDIDSTLNLINTALGNINEEINELMRILD